MSLSIPRAAARLLTVAAVVAFATAGLSGCSGSGADDSKTVTFLSWDGAKVMKPMVALFEKQNPGYTVDVSYSTPVAPYIQKLQTQLSSNSAPDVFIITAENKLQIMKGGFARDLSGESWAANLGSAEKATYTRGGKLYGSATSSWGGGLLVNWDLLKKAGISTFPTTWSDFLTMCKKLKAAGIQPYLESGGGVSVTLAALVGQQNAKYDGEMDKKIWAGDLTFAKAWTPAVKTWYELFSEGIVPTSVVGVSDTSLSEEFENGKVAMMGTGSWGLAGVQQAAPKLTNLSFEAVPGIGGSYWAGAVSPGLAVNAKAKHSAAALKFVEFMQSKSGVALYQKETGSITTTKDYTPKLDAALDAMVPDVRAGKFYLPAVSWVDHNDVLGTEATALVQQTIAGTITPQQFGQGLDTKLKSLN